jgi:integration host factor subunit alpha
VQRNSAGRLAIAPLLGANPGERSRLIEITELKMAKSELSARSDTPGPVPNGSVSSKPQGVRTVTRVNLAEAVYQQVGLSRKESAALVEMVLDEMTNRLVAGESVRLSSFGSFNVRHKGQRVGRNPKTGVEVPIKERRVLVFKSSNLLKARINGQLTQGNDD